MSTDQRPRVFHGMPRRDVRTYDGKRIVHVIPKGEPQLLGRDIRIQPVKVAFDDGTTVVGQVYL